MKAPKKQFALQTKINQAVYRIDINILAPGARPCSIYPAGITVNKLRIVYQTPHKIALSDDFITLLTRKEKGKRKESYETVLEDISVRVKTTETYFPNGIFATCYTLGSVESCVKKMKREILSHVKQNYGFMFEYEFEEKLNNLDIPESYK